MEDLFSRLKEAPATVDLRHEQMLRRALLNASCAPNGRSRLCLARVVSWTAGVVTGGVGVVVCVVMVHVLVFDVPSEELRMVAERGDMASVVATRSFGVFEEPVANTDVPEVTVVRASTRESTEQPSGFSSANGYVQPAVDHVRLFMKPVVDLASVQ